MRDIGRRAGLVVPLALAVLAVPSFAAAIEILPTLDLAGIYDYTAYQKKGPNVTPGSITFTQIVVQQALYEDLTACTRNGAPFLTLCDSAVGLISPPTAAVTATIIGLEQSSPTGEESSAFTSASIEISDASTTYLWGTIAAVDWTHDTGGNKLTLNLVIDADNLSVSSTDVGSPASRFITEFDAAVAAGAGIGDLPEIQIILNNFFFSGVTGQIADIEISSPVPEPGTALLLGSGLGILYARARRRSGRSQ